MKVHKWTPKAILEWVKKTHKGKSFSSQDVVAHFKMSRQTAARLLRVLVHENHLHKTGSTQTARYQVGAAKTKASVAVQIRWHKSLAGLAEDQAFEEASLRLLLQRRLVENVFRIAYYAFCEMLNNAIDHSQSRTADIEMGLEKGRFRFRVRDKGIGIFNNIRTGFRLNSDEDAVEHLLKGKQTTAPDAHTGQGIFFTSKIADKFKIRSGRLELSFDNLRQDLHLKQGRLIQGTEVSFEIKTHSRKSLRTLFETYANEDFDFDRTHYPVILLKQNGVLSRSQARRLVSGLDKFDRIILDFHKVQEMGQGFADEIFRIYQKKNPQLVIEVRNANSAVHFMIQRAIKDSV